MKIYLFIFVTSLSLYSVTAYPPIPTTIVTTTDGTTTNVPTTIIMTTTQHPVDTTTLARYVFEGVDYNDLPQELQDYHNDCYGQHIKCIRNRTDHYTVCGYNLYTGYYDNFYSPCEIELQNCYYRLKQGKGLYGTDYTNDIIFYNGEGLDCLYYMRRSKNAEDMKRLYFGESEWN